jgi:hypothetical protein
MRMRKKTRDQSWYDNDVEVKTSNYILIDWMTSSNNYAKYVKAKDEYGRTSAGSKLSVALEVKKHIFEKMVSLLLFVYSFHYSTCRCTYLYSLHVYAYYRIHLFCIWSHVQDCIHHCRFP